MAEKDTELMHAIVRGIVQGVNFRAYTVRAARELGVTGWVRNTSDGSVEVEAQGSREQLEALVHFLHTGSPSARVTEVEVTWLEADGQYDSFTVRYA